MIARESDTATAIASVVAIVIIVCVACLTHHNDTLIKLGIAAVAGLGGFSLSSIFRRNA
jgi:hypothetical protein